MSRDLPEKKEEKYMRERFAVLDTETNWNDEVMSIGAVVADSNAWEEIDAGYYLIDPEYRVGGMYAAELRLGEKKPRLANRKRALKEIREWLDYYGVKKLFAYNAAFDKKHLPEYSKYEWYDIMRLAAYRQYNPAIPDSADCFKTGRLKRGYGVEEILKMLRKNGSYSETHNALLDAQDELEIMRLLGHGLEAYEAGRVLECSKKQTRIRPYVPKTEEEIFAKLKTSRERGIFREADKAIADIRKKYGL